jgi:RNA polymerase sigma factor (sigma-70 family)
MGTPMSERVFDKTFWDDVLKRIMRRTRNRSEAEDLLQDAFLRLERYRADHVVADPAAFLVQTAVNIRIDNYRRTLQSATIIEEIASQQLNDQPLQDEVICTRARLTRVRAGLRRMPRKTREILLMHRLDELKYREIADRLGISQSTVEKHIAKAIVFLAEWAEGW